MATYKMVDTFVDMLMYRDLVFRRIFVVWSRKSRQEILSLPALLLEQITCPP